MPMTTHTVDLVMAGSSHHNDAKLEPLRENIIALALELSSSDIH
jgi:hypothetical protein